MRRFRPRVRRAGRGHRLGIRSGRLRRGTYRVRLVALDGRRRVRSTLAARRL